MVSAEVLAMVKEYLQIIKLEGITVSRAFIYGSQARGTATAESDIDVKIVSTLFDIEKDKYAPLLWGGQKRMEYKIEPYAVGEQRFLTDESSPIIALVKEEGTEVAT